MKLSDAGEGGVMKVHKPGEYGRTLCGMPNARYSRGIAHEGVFFIGWREVVETYRGVKPEDRCKKCQQRSKR